VFLGVVILAFCQAAGAGTNKHYPFTWTNAAFIDAI